jgi:hypothetical protein
MFVEEKVYAFMAKINIIVKNVEADITAIMEGLNTTVKIV